MSEQRLSVVRSNAATQKAILETVVKVRGMKSTRRAPGMEPVIEGGDSLPTPTGVFQVLMVHAFSGGSPPTYTLVFDWVRAHG